MKYIVFLLIFALSVSTYAQDLQCNVQVNSDNIQASNKAIFEDLQNAITQFMNQRKWISDKVQPQEKINCNFVINITAFNIDQFAAEVSITSSRPVYGTSYNTPVFNHFDQEWYFQYAQFQSLDFQENANVMQLTTLLAFYANIIIGVDFDTYALDGGSTFYNKALQLRNAAQNTNGWGPSDGKGNRNKYYVIDQLLDDRYKPLRTSLYQYHMKGMDVFKDDNDIARKQIYESLEKIRTVQERLPNSVIFKIFFNTKRQELINIFSKADAGLQNRAIELLGKLDPSNLNNYEKIKQ
ncbi:MAG TPA: hypothetical protein DD396_02155 [Bacteroidetes bacterium]|jgi:hypothetical protein|nr:hypothetical protein [Bacteroidota bacterium]|tara:strand:- start:6033 stop:6920 length:888 start_codon:yes stop_codon:yes gene_type:complete